MVMYRWRCSAMIARDRWSLVFSSMIIRWPVRSRPSKCGTTTLSSTFCCKHWPMRVSGIVIIHHQRIRLHGTSGDMSHYSISICGNTRKNMHKMGSFIWLMTLAPLSSRSNFLACTFSYVSACAYICETWLSDGMTCMQCWSSDGDTDSLSIACTVGHGSWAQLRWNRSTLICSQPGVTSFAYHAIRQDINLKADNNYFLLNV